MRVIGQGGRNVRIRNRPVRRFAGSCNVLFNVAPAWHIGKRDGMEVIWEQVGHQPHSVTADDETFDSNPDCSPLNSDKCMTAGDDLSFTFDEPGTYKYCRVHGLPSGTGMVGTITVQ